MQWQVMGALREAFDEQRPLYVAGALISRLQRPPSNPQRAASGHTYAYDVAHVDRANVASYDYSAVAYLNSQGDSFSGGDFCFVDEGGDEVVEPRVGRVVLFASGFEQLHRVCSVTSGIRFALAMWFTLTPSAAEGPVMPAHFQIDDPVPRPTPEELDAEACSLDALRAQVERKMERDSELQQMYGIHEGTT